MPQMPIEGKGPPAQAQPTASDPTTAGAAVSSNEPTGYTSSTKISSLGNLKAKAPKVYDFMLLSIAQNMCIEFKHAQDRLSRLWKDIRRNSGG